MTEREAFEAARIRVTPECKGYALLGTGMYCIESSGAPPDPELGAELFIRFATDADKSGDRQIGESRDTDPNAPPVQPEEMVIRIGFLSEVAIDALEEQLRVLRAENFPAGRAQAVQAGWRPMETAPKDGTVLLGWIVAAPDEYGGDGFEAPSLIHWDAGFKSSICDRKPGWIKQWRGEVTTWQPLPAPPSPSLQETPK